MIHWLRFAVRLLTVLYALWRSRAFPLFFLYFVAQLGDSLCEEIVYAFYGDLGPIYLYVYTAGTSLILLFALWITWDSIPSPYRLRKCAIPAVISMAVSRMAYLEVHRKIEASDLILFTAAATIFFCGQILTTAAAYALRNHTALFALGCLWLCQGVYFWGYLIHAPEWVLTGYWLPALLCSIGFIVTARLIRQPTQVYK